ncbi:MAG: ywoH [Firmicutes bacterium]|nr:ywoH [Bacillota bacterium]
MQNNEYTIPKLNKYIRMVNEAANKKLIPLGIYNGQWSVILALKELGSSPQSKLGQYLSIEAPTLTTMIQRLEEMGLVTRELSSDQRVKIVSLTEEAKRKFDLWNNKILEHRQELFKDFSNNDMIELHKIIDKLLKNVTNK